MQVFIGLRTVSSGHQIKQSAMLSFALAMFADQLIDKAPYGKG
jgi:hypothetical protein